MGFSGSRLGKRVGKASATLSKLGKPGKAGAGSGVARTASQVQGQKKKKSIKARGDDMNTLRNHNASRRVRAR